MLFYFSFSALAIAIALQSAIQHNELPNDASTWFFILLVGVLSPVTLPCMLRKKALDLYHRHVQTQAA
ncbi:hypothetical protein [Pseudanabaena sp. FACHB-2040]|uniref:hypothetical protein n=1 Tax=Pseudanabaena sp. FACHB-2040 TaxID=2692859 RepID=UPI001686CE64|nr:hypothetical protein [Pseudanabaena sp. FACHB-2040]MBD2261219.1 hypothetical protein [Pseudanabaena sp. FACHB-2040]